MKWNNANTKYDHVMMRYQLVMECNGMVLYVGNDVGIISLDI